MLDPGFEEARARMVRDLRSHGIRDENVLEAMGRVPRERFVAPSDANRAYASRALGIGRGQRISEPYIVARMAAALELTQRHAQSRSAPRVLDVGTGSGYQAAVLRAMGADVTGVEIDAALAADAGERLQALGYEVRVVVGDGSLGWPACASYDGIVVAAAMGYIPEPLFDQLAEGGRIVAPVGTRWLQRLTVVGKEEGRRVSRTLDRCRFVPLRGRFGLPEEFF